jgi:hypothetical protein
VPDRVLLLRVRFVVQQCFVLVTELRRLVSSPGTRARQREVDVTGADLVDYLGGGLAAPSRVASERRLPGAPGPPGAARSR